MSDEIIYRESESFEPDAFVIRTTNKDGASESQYANGFVWTREVGAIIDAPDWQPTAACGNGLHGCLDGVGNWAYLSSQHDALWWIVGVKRAECIDMGGKVKFPRGKVVYFGGINGALQTIAKEWRRVAQEAIEKAKIEDSAESVCTSGLRAHASTSGEDAHASTSGLRAHASTSGWGAHASTSGWDAHASTSEKQSVSSGLGINNQARAAEGGAICLVCRNGDGDIIAIRASKVGENGILPDVFYRLNENDEFEEVKETQEEAE